MPYLTTPLSVLRKDDPLMFVGFLLDIMEASILHPLPDVEFAVLVGDQPR